MNIKLRNVVTNKEDETKCPQWEVVTEDQTIIGYVTPMKGIYLQLSPNMKASKAWATVYAGNIKDLYSGDVVACMSHDVRKIENLLIELLTKFVNNPYGVEYELADEVIT